jgi:hypothetical protein
MVGEHRGGHPRAPGTLGVLLERLREGRVQLGPLTGEQVVVDRLAGERVAEGVPAPGVVDDQELVLDGLAERAVEVGLRQRGDDRQQPVGRPAAEARRRTSWASSPSRSARASRTSRSEGGR